MSIFRPLPPLLLLLALLPLGARELLLWQQGEPPLPIVVTPDSPEPARQAADALAKWLTLATREDWKVSSQAPAEGPAFLIGPVARQGVEAPDPHTLPHDAYWFRLEEDGQVRLAGRDGQGGDTTTDFHPFRAVEAWNSELRLCAFGDMGTWHGVHQLLETLGFRWYMPGKAGTEIPALEEIRLEEGERTVAPAFPYRYAWLGNFSNSPRDALWYRRIGYGAPAPVVIGHSYWMMLPQSQEHPEYFAWINGQRDTTNLSTMGGGNLCLSAPGQVEAWVELACQYFREHPGLDIFPLCPNDCLEQICQCADCQAQLSPHLGETGKFSNYIWGFADKVARALAERMPGKRIGCFAYSHYREVPDCLEELAPNLVVMICYHRQQERTPEGKALIRNAVAKWSAKTGGVYLWTYPHLNYWRPWRGFPRFYPQILAEDIRENQKLGVLGEFLESESYDGEEAAEIRWQYNFRYPALNHLTAYLSSKLLWNPSLDVDALLEDYYLRFYGPACLPMKEFWNKVETLTMERPAIHPFYQYDPDSAIALCALLEKAREATPEKSRYRQRVEMIQAEFVPSMEAFLKLQKRPLQEATLFSHPLPLEKRLWKEVAPREMVFTDGTRGELSTQVQVAADPRGLCFTVLCQEPEGALPDAPKKRHDHPLIWKDDTVELLLSSPEGDRGYHLILSPSGDVYDGTWQGKDGGKDDLSWAPALDYQWEVTPGQWLVQVRIPWGDLGLENPERCDFLFNLYRNRKIGPERYQQYGLFPTYTNLYRVPTAFGKLIIKNHN